MWSAENLSNGFGEPRNPSLHKCDRVLDIRCGRACRTANLLRCITKRFPAGRENATDAVRRLRATQ